MPYYQDVTDPNNLGAKVYQYDTGNVPYDITFSSPLSGMFNQVYLHQASNLAGANVVDDFRISEPVPEPSTLALLAAGLSVCWLMPGGNGNNSLSLGWQFCCRPNIKCWMVDGGWWMREWGASTIPSFVYRITAISGTIT